MTRLAEQYTRLQPAIGIGLPFKPRALTPAYLQWPLLPDLFPEFFAGVQSKRDETCNRHRTRAAN